MKQMSFDFPGQNMLRVDVAFQDEDGQIISAYVMNPFAAGVRGKHLKDFVENTVALMARQAVERLRWKNLASYSARHALQVPRNG